jgi:hypothetical protein
VAESLIWGCPLLGLLGETLRFERQNPEKLMAAATAVQERRGRRAHTSETGNCEGLDLARLRPSLKGSNPHRTGRSESAGNLGS